VNAILPLPNQDFKHLIALMLLMLSLFLQSVIVILALENRRSSLANITGINNISKAILERAR
jgi:hypothetical protein